MSERIVVTLLHAVERPLDASALAPDAIAALPERELAALPLRRGRETITLGDLGAVRGHGSERVVIEGDATPLVRLGAGMAGGTLEIMGSAGDALGAGMSGGTIVVHGAAGDDVGGAQPASPRGMRGGEIVVHGSVGARAGARMRRGLVVAGGGAGEGAGAGAIAGTVIVMGDAERGAAVGSKRGTLVVMGRVEVPESFRLACEYAPPHLRLVLTYLERRHALRIGAARRDGRYRRWSGDMAELSRGEILQWTGS